MSRKNNYKEMTAFSSMLEIIFSHIRSKKAPHHKGEALLRQFLGFNLHPAGQPEHDPVLTVHRHHVVADCVSTRFPAGVKARSLHRSSFPMPNHFVGFAMGSRYRQARPTGSRRTRYQGSHQNLF